MDFWKTYVPQLADHVTPFRVYCVGDEFPSADVLWRENSGDIEEVSTL